MNPLNPVNPVNPVRPINPNPGGNPFGPGGGTSTGRWDRPDWGQNTGLNPRFGPDATELDKFREATNQYDRKNWSTAAQILESLLNVRYDSWGSKQFTFNYVASTTTGSLDETSFFRACSLLVLSYGRLGDMERANAAMTAVERMVPPSNFSLQTLLSQTKGQLAEIANSTPGTPANLLSDAEQQRILRECNSMYRLRRFDGLDEKLKDLMARSETPFVKAEAALLRARIALERKRDREMLEMLNLIVNDFSETDPYRDALWLLGLYYESSGDSVRGAEYFQRLVDEAPNDKNIDGALYFLAWDDIENNGGRKATTWLTRIYRNHPNGMYWSHATWTLAWLSYKKRDYTQAEVYVQRILQHPPDYAILDRVLYLKGELSLQRKDYDTATIAFREVSRLVPDSPLRDNADRNAQVAAKATVRVN